MFTAIARPFGLLMMFLYDTVQNYGVAIILFALVIKIILLPFQMKSKRGMMRQQRLQPKIAELQKKHGTNKQKINEEMTKLYKEEGVNPASGCLWGFLPLPIMLALYQVIRQPITIMMGVASELLLKADGDVPAGRLLQMLNAEGFVQSGGDTYVQIQQSQFISKNFDKFKGLFENLRQIDFNFLGIDLGLQPSWKFLWNNDLETYGTWVVGFILFLIPFISGGVQFLATQLNKKMNPVAAPEGGPGGGSMQMMMMMMPLFSVYIAFITPAALGFYWTVSTVFQVIQDIWLTKVYTKKIDAEEAIKNEARALKEAEIEAKRIETERRKAEGLVERNPNTAKRKKQKSDKQEQLEKASDWQKKHAPEKEERKNEPGRVGSRRYARGRAYDPDRYLNSAGDKDDEDLAGQGGGGSEDELLEDGYPDDADDVDEEIGGEDDLADADEDDDDLGDDDEDDDDLEDDDEDDDDLEDDDEDDDNLEDDDEENK